jgi:hypothetical protein
MNKVVTLIIILTLSSAVHKNKHITPYGDYCSVTSHYGMHHGMLSNEQIEKALKHYFGKKGLDFKIINNKGRFVKAHVKSDDKVIDTIIFDRHSGRIRSIR